MSKELAEKIIKTILVTITVSVLLECFTRYLKREFKLDK